MTDWVRLVPPEQTTEDWLGWHRFHTAQYLKRCTVIPPRDWKASPRAYTPPRSHNGRLDGAGAQNGGPKP